MHTHPRCSISTASSCHRNAFLLAAGIAAAILLVCALLHPGTAPASDPEPSTPPGITVHGTFLVRNGASEVPRGLFGVHNTRLSEEELVEWGVESVREILFNPSGRPIVIDGIRRTTDDQGREQVSGRSLHLHSIVECFWDRFQPALQLRHADWKERLQDLARRYGEAARETGQTHHIEFWNEPYLNWSTHPGVNYIEDFYIRPDAIKPGMPMRLRTTGEVVEHMVWDREIFVTGRNKDYLNFYHSSKIPDTAREGETVKLRGAPGEVTLERGGTVHIHGRDHPLFLRWIGRDVTQEFYWAGTVNVRLYNEMLEVFGQALKEANPDVRLAGGWGFNFFNEEWESWHRLIRPTIDRTIEWIDALHEHHYGGDTRLVAASYEVAYNYTQATHGKRITIWNTEVGGHLDPEQPGTITSWYHGDPLTRARAAMTYMLRDISYILAHNPDKGVKRAAHHARDTGGEELAFRLLRPVRGRLLHVETGIPHAWAVASVEEDSVRLLVYNDAHETRTLPLTVHAPGGARFVSGTQTAVVETTRTRTRMDDEGNEVETEEPWLALESGAVMIEGSTWEAKVEIPGYAARVVVLETEGVDETRVPVRTRIQYGSERVLVPLTEDPQTLAISVPAAELVDMPRGLSLRLVTERWPEDAVVELNGTPLALNVHTPYILDHPVPVLLLREKNELRVHTPGGRGGSVLTVALVLER